MKTPLEAPEKQVAEETSARPASASVIDTSKMSKGQREALELAEASRDPLDERGSFASNLFIGRYDFDRIFPYPAQSDEDRAKGEPFLNELRDYLAAHVDADEIDRTGEIPQKNIDDLFAMGAFGVKIPTQYGGLGLSQVNYGRAAMLLGSWDANVTALVSAHQSIGVPQPLKMFGTPEQKRKYLPRCASGAISAFALTEADVGSDPAQLSTTAERSADGSHWTLNGEKLWCTNGTLAELFVVMARDPGTKRISAFVVEADWPGVRVEHRLGRWLGAPLRRNTKHRRFLARAAPARLLRQGGIACRQRPGATILELPDLSRLRQQGHGHPLVSALQQGLRPVPNCGFVATLEDLVGGRRAGSGCHRIQLQ